MSTNKEQIYLAECNLDVLVSHTYDGDACTIRAVYNALSSDKSAKYIYDVNAQIEYLFNRSQFSKFQSVTDSDTQEKLIVAMIFETTRYQTRLREVIYPLLKKILINDCPEKGVFINSPNIAKALMDTYLPLIDSGQFSNKFKNLTMQYNYSLKLLEALRHPSPAESMRAARKIFRDPQVRHQLAATNGFWEWILKKLGFNKGVRLLKFFQKSNNSFREANLQANAHADHAASPRVNIEPSMTSIRVKA
jgi:hypothetical protein